MQDRNFKALLCKLIFFYSVFYIIMKIIAILFQNIWVLPNLILSLPFLVFAGWGYYIMKTNTFNWVYVICGIIVISAVRYKELEWMQILHDSITTG